MKKIFITLGAVAMIMMPLTPVFAQSYSSVALQITPNNPFASTTIEGGAVEPPLCWMNNNAVKCDGSLGFNALEIWQLQMAVVDLQNRVAALEGVHVQQQLNTGTTSNTSDEARITALEKSQSQLQSTVVSVLSQVVTLLQQIKTK
jgi:hypothetical protein